MGEGGLIPSGPWHGFYTYRSRTDRHRMDLRLEFHDGSIAGSGIDDVGRFAIEGTYDPETLRCFWRKTYLGRHTVLYDGAWDLGSIWGLWTIPPWSKGGFRIWPRGTGEGLELTAEAEIDEPLRDRVPVTIERENPGDVDSALRAT